MRVREHDHVATAEVADVVGELVDEDPVPDLERRVHGLGRDVEGLDQERLDEDRHGERHEDEERGRSDEAARAAVPVARFGLSPVRLSGVRVRGGGRLRFWWRELARSDVGHGCWKLTAWPDHGGRISTSTALNEAQTLDAVGQPEASTEPSVTSATSGGAVAKPNPRAVALDRDRRHPPWSTLRPNPPAAASESVTSEGRSSPITSLAVDTRPATGDDVALTGRQAVRPPSLERLEPAAERVDTDEVRRVARSRRGTDLLGRADLRDAAVLEQDQPVGERRGLDGVVRHDDADAGEASRARHARRSGRGSRADVERRERFVKQQQRRLGDEGPRERDPLRFAPREIARTAPGARSASPRRSSSRPAALASLAAARRRGHEAGRRRSPAPRGAGTAAGPGTRRRSGAARAGREAPWRASSSTAPSSVIVPSVGRERAPRRTRRASTCPSRSARGARPSRPARPRTPPSNLERRRASPRHRPSRRHPQEPSSQREDHRERDGDEQHRRARRPPPGSVCRCSKTASGSVWVRPWRFPANVIVAPNSPSARAHDETSAAAICGARSGKRHAPKDVPARGAERRRRRPRAARRRPRRPRLEREHRERERDEGRREHGAPVVVNVNWMPNQS